MTKPACVWLSNLAEWNKYTEATGAVLNFFLSSKFSTSCILPIPPPLIVSETLRKIPIYKRKIRAVLGKGGWGVRGLCSNTNSAFLRPLSVPPLLTMTSEAPLRKPLAPRTQAETNPSNEHKGLIHLIIKLQNLNKAISSKFAMPDFSTM